MGESKQSAEDLAILERPNVGYSRSDPLRDLKVRILGDVALIHGRTTYTLLTDGAEQEAERKTP